jgi:hypothetical protein
VVLAWAGVLGGRLADREQHREGGGEDGDQRDRDRQVVDSQRPGDQVLRIVPLPDQQAGRGREGQQRQQGRGRPLGR